MKRSISAKTGSIVALGAAALIACVLPHATLAQAEGGLYIADNRSNFERAAEQGLARNPAGQRFFVLALPPNTVALTTAATPSAAALRERVVAVGGLLLVCQRDIDDGKVDAAALVPGVFAVRGFPPRGSNAIPRGERYYPDEDRMRLPQDNRSLKRLRKACT
jgi:predicted RecA/RadA family phage recombinase